MNPVGPNPFLNCPNDITHEIISRCLFEDMDDFPNLYCVSRQWAKDVESIMQAPIFYNKLLEDLKRKGLQIIDAKALGLTLPDEPPINIAILRSMFFKMVPHVLNDAKCSLLTIPPKTINSAFLGLELFKDKEIYAHTLADSNALDKAIQEGTSRVLITNAVFTRSIKAKCSANEELALELKVQIPTAQEYTFLCLSSYAIFNKQLYGEISAYPGISCTQSNRQYAPSEPEHFIIGVDETRFNQTQPTPILFVSSDSLTLERAASIGGIGGVYRFKQP